MSRFFNHQPWNRSHFGRCDHDRESRINPESRWKRERDYIVKSLSRSRKITSSERWRGKERPEPVRAPNCQLVRRNPGCGIALSESFPVTVRRGTRARLRATRVSCYCAPCNRRPSSRRAQGDGGAGRPARKKVVGPVTK